MSENDFRSGIDASSWIQRPSPRLNLPSKKNPSLPLNLRLDSSLREVRPRQFPRCLLHSEHRPRHPMEILVCTGFGVTHTAHPCLVSLHLSSLARS